MAQIQLEASCYFATKSLDEYLYLQQCALLEIATVITTCGCRVAHPTTYVQMDQQEVGRAIVDGVVGYTTNGYANPASAASSVSMQDPSGISTLSRIPRPANVNMKNPVQNPPPVPPTPISSPPISATVTDAIGTDSVKPISNFNTFNTESTVFWFFFWFFPSS